jgi:hypothetical protein
MAIERFTFEITGTSPILMNNPAGMSKPVEGPQIKKKVPTPTEEAEGLLYIQPDGSLCGPAMAFKSIAATAGKGRKIGKAFAPGLVKMAVFTPIDVEFVTLYDPKTRKPLTKKDYTVDSRRCVLKNGGKAAGVVRSRPRVERWACDVVLEIDTELANPKDIEQLLQLGGRTVGYLDFRPEKGGPFGRFEAKLKEGKAARAA